jgi:SNF2 family DNA or RNA helicase
MVQVETPEGLHSYQTTAVQFTQRAVGRAFVGDDPGTGKTIITLGWVYDHLSELRRILVVAPTVVLYKWQAEVKRWLGPNVGAHVVDKVDEPLNLATFQIMSYTMMRLRQEELLEEWDLVIFDEAHHLKNPKALQTRAARKIAKLASYRIMLSGKPFLNHIREMWYPLNTMNPKAFPNWFKFMSEFTQGKSYGWKGLKNPEKLRKVLAPHMIRRTKKEVLGELPELQRVLLPFKLQDDELRVYELVEEQALEAPNALAAATLLRVSVGALKAKAAIDWAEDFLDQADGEKLVVYCHHLAVMSQIFDALVKFGVQIIDGSMSAKERNKRAETFQNEELPRVLIINTAANEGIDLYRASNILFAEREWVPNTEEQAEGRLHRRGQKNAVVAWYILAKDTFDEHLDDVINHKRELFASAMKSDEWETSVIHDVLKRLRDRRKERETDEGMDQRAE